MRLLAVLLGFYSCHVVKITVHLGTVDDVVKDLPTLVGEVARLQKPLGELVHAPCKLLQSDDLLAIDGVFITALNLIL